MQDFAAKVYKSGGPATDCKVQMGRVSVRRMLACEYAFILVLLVTTPCSAARILRDGSGKSLSGALVGVMLVGELFDVSYFVEAGDLNIENWGWWNLKRMRSVQYLHCYASRIKYSTVPRSKILATKPMLNLTRLL